MAVTAASFRVDFPEFKSAKLYPDSQINFWLSLAGAMLSVPRWANMLDAGTELFIAHNLSLGRRNQAESANGAPPGAQVGPLNNKSVDKASAGYDVSAGVNPDDGHWNLTNYGTRFIWLLRMVGAGPVQVGAAGCGPDGSINGAWPGPWPYNFPNQN